MWSQRIVANALVLLLVLLHGMARAQSPHASAPDLSTIAPGQKVLVTMTDGAVVEGRVRTITQESLSLDSRTGIETIALARVGRLVVKDSTRNGMLIGLAIGAGMGLAGGLTLNAICSNEGGPCFGTVALLAGVGSAGGAAIGAGLDGLRHRTVFDRLSPDVPGEFSPELGGNVGIGWSQAGGLGVTGPASAGFAWTMTHSSRLGFILDVSRTMGRRTKTISCAEASAGGSFDHCIGQGEQGVVSTTTASARVLYALSSARIRPYVSGGAAVYEDSLSAVTTIRPPWLPGPPFALQSLHRYRGVALSVGGGVRARLARHLSARPDVTLHKGNDWTHVRVSAGIDVGW